MRLLPVIPLLLALLGGALLLISKYFSLEDWIEIWVVVTSRVCFAAALGWLIWRIVDTLLYRRLKRLRLDVADNLAARKTATRLNVLRRMWAVLMAVLTLAAALTLIPWARQIGVSLFASAGIAGIVIGIAARPVLSNLIAGLQIAFTQPIRIDDAVVVEGEWGWIEEIDLFHVVIRIWDLRRLVVPLNYFIEQPFQNWTRKSARIIGSVFWSLDYRAPIERMRTRLREICEANPLWDGDVCVLQVTDTDNQTIQIRALATARTSPDAWDLRCDIREKMICWLQAEHPEALPMRRADIAVRDAEPAAAPEPVPDGPPARDPSLLDGPTGGGDGAAQDRG